MICFMNIIIHNINFMKWEYCCESSSKWRKRRTGERRKARKLYIEKQTTGKSSECRNTYAAYTHTYTYAFRKQEVGNIAQHKVQASHYHHSTSQYEWYYDTIIITTPPLNIKPKIPPPHHTSTTLRDLRIISIYSAASSSSCLSIQETLAIPSSLHSQC